MKKLSVRISRKIYLGNYESINPEIELSGEPSDFDLPQECPVSTFHEKVYNEAASLFEKTALDEINAIIKRRESSNKN